MATSTTTPRRPEDPPAGQAAAVAGAPPAEVGQPAAVTPDGPGAGPRPRRGRRLLHRRVGGLRARVTATFALGALVVSGVLAVVIFITSRGLIIDQQVSLLQSQAYENAIVIRATLSQPQANLYALLQSLNQPDSDSALYFHKGWYGTYFFGGQDTPAGAETRLPPALVSSVMHHTPVEETYVRDGSPRFAIGIPIAAVDAAYFEEFDLGSVQSTLHHLLIALIAAALASTLAGAVFGRWSAGRALRPLRDVTAAASAIAGGRLGTRLDTGDVAELEVLASSFNQMVDRLQDRIERDARFNADVSHELRSPLTTLTASFSVLEARAAEMPERAQRAISLASAEMRRFQRMVADLLEISRLDAGSKDMSLEEVQVGELVRRTAETAVRDLRAHNMMPTGDGQLGFPLDIAANVAERRVLVDKRRFERIVANLLENAAVYGGGATRMGVEGRGAMMRLAVEDDGPGIPPEEQARIFERFSRGTSARRRGAGEGTGLGLAIVAEHTRLHGGKVWVEAAASGGARFVVELPFAPRRERE